MSDKELIAMQSVLSALDDIDDDAKKRVLIWVGGRIGLAQSSNSSGPAGSGVGTDNAANNRVTRFSTFAELFDSMSPTTNAEKVLAASYWLQVCSSQEQFASQSVNKELQDLGYALKNVTQAFTALKDRKPALAIQIKKSGKSQQARKLYKLTKAGISAVESMIQGDSAE